MILVAIKLMLKNSILNRILIEGLLKHKMKNKKIVKEIKRIMSSPSLTQSVRYERVYNLIFADRIGRKGYFCRHKNEIKSKK